MVGEHVLHARSAASAPITAWGQLGEAVHEERSRVRHATASARTERRGGVNSAPVFVTILASQRAQLPAEPMTDPALRPDLVRDVARRRTFAIISHPDAGKTTLTEKLLLFGGAIQMAGTVKARRSSRHATSDWMEVEKQRGISVTSSVMQFDYAGHTHQPARYARPRGFLRGHLPRAHRRRRGGHGDRRGQGRGGPDHQAARGLPAARHADHHLRQQDGPRGARPHRSARTRSSPRSPSTARR